MAKSKLQLKNELKNYYMSKLMELMGAEEDVLQYKDAEFCFPVVDSEGNDEYIQIKICIPSGSRDGEPFDGYAEAENYQLMKKQKAEKKKAAAEAKAKKIARDKKLREKKAEAKAQAQESAADTNAEAE